MSGDDGFTQVGRGRGKQRPSKHGLSTDNTSENLAKLKRNVDDKYARIKSSKLFEQVLDAVKSDRPKEPISAIRCVALGRLSGLQAPMYQLCLLRVLVEQFGVQPEHVSLWDPLFNELDRRYLQETLGYTVEERFAGSSKGCLYYMPHPPASLVEEILRTAEPEMMLSNDLRDFNAAGKNAGCRYCAYVSRVLKEGGKAEDANGDGFETVGKGKKSTGKAKAKAKAKQSQHKRAGPEAEAPLPPYFSKATTKVFRYDMAAADWGTAFSDLAYIRLM